MVSRPTLDHTAESRLALTIRPYPHLDPQRGDDLFDDPLLWGEEFFGTKSFQPVWVFPSLLPRSRVNCPPDSYSLLGPLLGGVGLLAHRFVQAAMDSPSGCCAQARHIISQTLRRLLCVLRLLGEVSAMLRLCFLMVLATLSGCIGQSLGEVRATKPVQTGLLKTPYEALAACVRERIETDSWRFGQPIVQTTREKDHQLIRLYASHSRSTLFVVTFQPTPPDQTTVEYRRGYDGHGTQDQTWGIIESCAQQGLVQTVSTEKPYVFPRQSSTKP